MAHRSSHKPTPPLPFLLDEAADEDEDETTDPDGGAAASSQPGAIVGGHRLAARIALGGMAEVWLADVVKGTRAGQSVALKRLLPALRGDLGVVARFRDEARLGSLADHPNLARAYQLVDRGGELAIVQELVGGETIAQLAVAARTRGSGLPPEASVHAVLCLLQALEHLHGGVPGRFPPTIHGDVNPENLISRTDGVVKLVDLGLAEPLGPDGLAGGHDGALRGTPAYMAPEQVKGGPLTVRSDLFSSGTVLWELLANRPLFAAGTEFETLRRVRELAAPPLRAVWPQAPTVLERLCVRALAKDPATRFGSAAEMADALRQAASRESFPDGAAALAREVRRLAPRAVEGD